jgi:hypothetical protein
MLNVSQHPTGKPQRRSAQKLDHQLQSLILLGYFAFMFVLAFALPENFSEMRWIAPLIDFGRQWAPNIVLIAARATAPDLVESYLILGLLCCLPTFIAYIVLRPDSSTFVPFDSWVVKGICILCLSLFVLVMSGFWWNPIASEFDMGPTQGRYGALMALALSGRWGAAIVLNLLFCWAPLGFAIAMWIGIAKPVRKTVDFTHQYDQTKTNDISK